MGEHKSFLLDWCSRLEFRAQHAGAPSLAESVGNTYQAHNSGDGGQDGRTHAHAEARVTFASHVMRAATDRSLWQHCLVLATAVTDLSELLKPEKTRNTLKRNAAGFTLHMCLRVATQEVGNVSRDVVDEVHTCWTKTYAGVAFNCGI